MPLLLWPCSHHHTPLEMPILEEKCICVSSFTADSDGVQEFKGASCTGRCGGSHDRAHKPIAKQLLWRAPLGDGGCAPGQLVPRKRTQRWQIAQKVVHLGGVVLALQDVLLERLQVARACLT